MKRDIFPILLVAMTLAFCACERYEAPEFEVPTYKGEPANKTIQDIIDVYTSAGKMDSICHAGETFIVKATVVSSDEGGNFYKSMVLQDETGAIQMQINTSGLCYTYPVGQTVYLNCQGLVVGNYHGVYQVGWIYQGSVGRIDPNYLDRYLSKDGIPADITPMITDINSPADLNASNVSKLVRIKNCQFSADVVGQPLAVETTTTNRAIATINGEACNDFVVRTSNYAKFRKHLIPAGSGDLTGILSVYNSGSTSTYQLMLCTVDDIGTFGTYQEVFSADFSNGADSWITSEGWSFYPAQSCMLHRSTDGCDDWLISPVISISDLANGELYVNEKFSSNVGQTDMVANYTIWYTTVLSGTPAESDWHLLQVSNYPTGFQNTIIEGTQAITGNCRIGFRYRSDAACPTEWAIKRLYIMKVVEG